MGQAGHGASGGGGRVDRADLRRAIVPVLNRAWRDPGYCVPNLEVYPHQWLWDSCFHAVVWAALGSDRGVTEVASALARQADDGFVPHMVYWQQPELHRDFWGRPGASVITQPPMYGHALAEQRRQGWPVPDELVARARRGLLHLGRRPRTPAGLVPILHPWESGCDDSPRWDRHLPVPVGDDEAVAAARFQRKGQLVDALVRSPDGHGVDSPAFAVGSIGFNALVAWNAAELSASFDQPDDALDRLAGELSEAVAGRWRQDRWIDDPGRASAADTGPATTGGDPEGVRTVGSLTALLVDPRPEAFDQLLDPDGFGAPYGPRGVHRAEDSYEPDTYWRGSAWPQLTYLLMVAAERAGRHGATRTLGRWLVDGAMRSGLAEHWNPETGEGLGARPQTWAGLALLAARRC